MSAKNRARADGTTYEPAANDDYPTPAWAVRRLLDVVGPELTAAGMRWIEPCASAGNIIRAVNDWQANSPRVGTTTRDAPTWHAVELQHRYARPLAELGVRGAIFDFRVWARRYAGRAFDVAFTNPPFSMAEEILDDCQRIARVTVLLVRVGFLASSRRGERHAAWAPDAFILPNRPQFVAGGQDNSDYCWAIWDHDAPRPKAVGRLQCLALTPLEERKGERTPRMAMNTPRRGVEGP